MHIDPVTIHLSEQVTAAIVTVAGSKSYGVNSRLLASERLITPAYTYYPSTDEITNMIPTRIALRGLARHARRLTPLSSTASLDSSASTAASSSSSSSPSTSGRIGQYLVNRSASGELPVYSENTRGTVWKTIIRRIDVSHTHAYATQTVHNPKRPNSTQFNSIEPLFFAQDIFRQGI